jgi:excisionase family DNA binding protein
LENAMPTTAARVKSPAQSYDPLKPLAEAIGSVLADTVGKKQATSGALSSKVSRALHQVLEARTPQSRSARMLLIRHLVDIESQDAGIEIPKMAATANDLIGTAQAAELLGYSRPHVAMLIDQNKLQGATVSAGGHRRVSRAAVLAWKEQHQASGKGADLRTEGQKIGAYKSTEAEVVRRVKALTEQK